MNKLFDEIHDFINNPEPKQGILTDDQINAIIISLALSRGEEGFPEDEVFQLVKWFESAVISHTLVELFFEGLVSVNWNGEEPLFKQTELEKQAYADYTNRKES